MPCDLPYGWNFMPHGRNTKLLVQLESSWAVSVTVGDSYWAPFCSFFWALVDVVSLSSVCWASAVLEHFLAFLCPFFCLPCHASIWTGKSNSSLILWSWQGLADVPACCAPVHYNCCLLWRYHSTKLQTLIWQLCGHNLLAEAMQTVFFLFFEVDSFLHVVREQLWF